MVTPFDKALVGFLIPIFALINQKYGFAFPVDPDLLAALVAGITGLAVYVTPNKAKGS